MELDNRVTELIAVGASVTANCLSCLEFHAGKATEYGVTKEEVARAVEVGQMVRRGAAAKIDTLIASLQKGVPSATTGSTASCCCP